MVVQEPPLPQITPAQQTVLLTIVAGLATAISTVVIVETSEPNERGKMRRERYATLAGTAVVVGLTGALILALNARSDGLIGNVG